MKATMLIATKISRLFLLINVFAWISLPVLAWSSNGWLHAHQDLATLIDGRAVYMAIESVEDSDLVDIEFDVFNAFVNDHIQAPSAEDQTHIHGTLNSCCSLGGLSCDGGLSFHITPAIGQYAFDVPNSKQASSLTGIEAPPLYHPPKRDI